MREYTRQTYHGQYTVVRHKDSKREGEREREREGLRVIEKEKEREKEECMRRK